jgi:hypothetical protein
MSMSSRRIFLIEADVTSELKFNLQILTTKGGGSESLLTSVTWLHVAWKMVTDVSEEGTAVSFPV